MEPCSSNKKSSLNIFEKNKKKEEIKEIDLKSQEIAKKISGLESKQTSKTLDKVTLETKFMDLPNELILQIFYSFVNLPNFKIKDLCNLRLVSRQYKLFSEDHSLWKLFLNERVQNSFSGKMKWEIFRDNFQRAIFDAKSFFNSNHYLNKLTFFSDEDDSYGILEPNILTKIILLWVKRVPTKVIKKMEEFAVSSEECRFQIASSLVGDDFLFCMDKLIDNLEKFDLSKEHKEKIIGRVKYFQDKELKKRENGRKYRRKLVAKGKNKKKKLRCKRKPKAFQILTEEERERREEIRKQRNEEWKKEWKEAMKDDMKEDDICLIS